MSWFDSNKRGKAATYLRENQWDSMLIYCNRAIRIDPDYAGAYGRKARYFQNVGQPDSAIQNLLINSLFLLFFNIVQIYNNKNLVSYLSFNYLI